MTNWCRDIPRDEAVRAAEDNRQGPLPTLEAVIAEPFADGPKCSPEVSETGEGQSGMRTEWVTLEVKHGNSLNVRDWPSLKSAFGESVRVVEDQRESHLEAQRGVIDTLTRQRDAAIRERDEAKARAAELERAYSAECDARAQAHRELSDLAEAVRERESGEECDHSYAAQCREAAAARDRADRMMPAPAASGAAGKSVGSELAGRLSRFADRVEAGETQSGLRTELVVPPAPVSRPAETRLTTPGMVPGGLWFPPSDKPAPPPPPAPPRVHRGSGVFDANGDELPWEGVVAMLTAERDAAIREREEFRLSFRSSEDGGARLVAQRDAALDDADKLRARVAELESAAKLAPAANADAISNQQPISGAGKSAVEETQPARRWLTAEEREELDYLCPENPNHTVSVGTRSKKILRGILARSSPPEVVLTEVFNHFDTYGDRVASFDADHVRKALVAAGVTVKQVGK